MHSNNNTSLKPFNTLGVEVNARTVVIAETVAEIYEAWKESEKSKLPFLVLGEGSNVLLLEDFLGIVVINRLKGITVDEDDDEWYVHVGAGENWHALVVHTLEQSIFGLENLALIPGCVGSAPVQNIGAYGLELVSVCNYVDVLDFSKNEIIRMSAAECEFGHRDSIFMHRYKYGYAIVAVGFRLSKVWKPVLTYGQLAELCASNVTPMLVFATVCRIRSEKLPDPKVIGNAGSFFKNPLVSTELATSIIQKCPGIPQFQQNGQVKLAAGWLIEQCQLKGYRHGGGSVYSKQALVLINENGATPFDFVALAAHVRQCVGKTFNVWLVPEVRFIGAMGEVDAVQLLDSKAMV